MIFLSVGENVDPSGVMAQSMLLEANWERLVIEAFSNDQTLSGTAVTIGSDSGAAFMLSSPDLEWRQWNQRPHWTMTFDIPVLQEHTF